ncbi:uncharacterized protein LOC108092211 isoform X2 [Drosophila ficusphila]|uniref:uncharacterized protein LOC108092211 isoform X2 n=1 Tax=Drosophila ficusphila TaxID=30025 RepID=UPI0007E6EF24|nr:uncharacterized protein LOC108092211 isoform X2 [Drosophila ficusphila]
MATLCRTCGQEAEHAQSLFDKKSSDVLYNILKLTGLWLSEKPDVPSRICLSCLLDLKEAIAFRERCIKTNSSWFNEQEEDQNALHLEIFPVSTLEPKMIPSQRHVPHQQTSKPDERSSKAIDDPICPLIIPDVSLGELMDPLRCEIIPVKNEPLYLDEEAEQIRDPETVDEEKNQEDTDRTSEKQLIADDDSSKHSSNHEVTKRNHSLTIKKRV